MTLPGNKTVQYAYDVKGQLVSLTDWDGQVTRYRYDNAGRLREAQGANLLTHRWRYDAAGRLRGLRHSREGKTLGDFAYEVDKRGNRTQVRECVPQAAPGTTVLTHSSPAIDYVRGTWAAVGAFHETTNMGAALRTEVFGTELILVMGQGPDHSVYDVYLNGTLRDSLDGYAATPGERSLSYSLTDEGPHTVEVRNRMDKSLASSGYKLRFKSLTTNRRYDLHTIQYSYDKLERLRAADYHPAANLSAAPFRQHSYAYDVAGNRTQVNDNGAVTNYTYNAANQIANPGFSYDAAGRMTSDGVNTYTWDRADRLLSMGGVQSAYNGLGQRVQQSVGAQVTQYLLDTQPGLWQVLAAMIGHDASYRVCLFVELRFLAECGCGVDKIAPQPRYVQPELLRSNASSCPERVLKRSDTSSDARDSLVSRSVGTGSPSLRRRDPMIRSSGRKTFPTCSSAGQYPSSLRGLSADPPDRRHKWHPGAVGEVRTLVPALDQPAQSASHRRPGYRPVFAVARPPGPRQTLPPQFPISHLCGAKYDPVVPNRAKWSYRTSTAISLVTVRLLDHSPISSGRTTHYWLLVRPGTSCPPWQAGICRVCGRTPSRRCLVSTSFPLTGDVWMCVRREGVAS